MYLSVFIYSVEGVGPRNVRPIKMLVPNSGDCEVGSVGSDAELMPGSLTQRNISYV